MLVNYEDVKTHINPVAQGGQDINGWSYIHLPFPSADRDGF
jgi:hypothetical protein